MRTTTLLLAAVLLVSCGSDGDVADAPRDAADGTAVSIVPADSGTDAGPVELPDSFPSEVPVPEAVELEHAEAHVGGSSTIFEVTGWYDGDPVRVARDYEATLEDLGYEITSRTESPDNLFYVAENGDWYVSAGFFPDPMRGEGASVGLTVAPAG